MRKILSNILFDLRTIFYMCNVVENNNFKSLRKR